MSDRVTVLTGGVGGAKLVLGLSRLLPAAEVTAIVNTADDFEHLGLVVSPDIDTLLYTLSGQANKAQGWGREGETWNFMAALRSLGGEDWFALGDGDLALHVLRTSRLQKGETLSTIIADFANLWHIGTRILPMSDDQVRTHVDTSDGDLPFQQYFVRHRCEPEVRAIRFEGSAGAHPAPGVVESIIDPECGAVIIAPSNPFLSIDPILSIPAIRAALHETAVPVIAVSPLVGRDVVKGPTAKLMREKGLRVDARTIADHYGGVIDGLLVDSRDPPIDLPVRSARADTLMYSLEDRVRVARAVLDLAGSIRE